VYTLLRPGHRSWSNQSYPQEHRPDDNYRLRRSARLDGDGSVDTLPPGARCENTEVDIGGVPLGNPTMVARKQIAFSAEGVHNTGKIAVVIVVGDASTPLKAQKITNPQNPMTGRL